MRVNCDLEIVINDINKYLIVIYDKTYNFLDYNLYSVFLIWDLL